MPRPRASAHVAGKHVQLGSTLRETRISEEGGARSRWRLTSAGVFDRPGVPLHVPSTEVSRFSLTITAIPCEATVTVAAWGDRRLDAARSPSSYDCRSAFIFSLLVAMILALLSKLSAWKRDPPSSVRHAAENVQGVVLPLGTSSGAAAGGSAHGPQADYLHSRSATQY